MIHYCWMLLFLTLGAILFFGTLASIPGTSTNPDNKLIAIRLSCLGLAILFVILAFNQLLKLVGEFL